MASSKLQLYTFWRSQAAYRVRIALHLKGLAFEPHVIDLLKGDQYGPAYRKLNPGAVVPTLIDADGPPLVQSLAILEYLEETHPQPAILPVAAADRAHARALGQIVAMEAHTLIVPRIRHYLEKEFHLDQAMRMQWIRHWMDGASSALEEMLVADKRTGKFCVGDQPTIADICMVAHFVSTIMLYKNDIGRWPTARRIFDACMALDAFSTTHPLRQPDAPPPGQAGH
jgi:maleylacetoacetate isomerase